MKQMLAIIVLAPLIAVLVFISWSAFRAPAIADRRVADSVVGDGRGSEEPVSGASGTSGSDSRESGMPLRGGSSSKDVLLDSHKLDLESLSTLKATIDSSSLSEVDKRALMHWALLSCRAGWGASLKSPEEKRDSQLKEHLDALIAFNRTFCAGDSAPENSDAAMAWLKALDSDPEVVEVMALANSALRDRDEAALSLLGESISTVKSEAAMEKAIYVLAQVERKNGRATWSLGSDYTRGLDGLTIQKLQRNAGLLAACAEFGGCGPNSPRYIFLCEQSQQCRRGESVEQYVLRFTAPGHVPALQRMVADIRAMRPR